MTTPTPVLLPGGFTWRDSPDGCTLFAGGAAVLHVTRQNGGWIVRVDVPGDDTHSRKVVVGSRMAGVRFGNKWARSHKEMMTRFDPRVRQDRDPLRQAAAERKPDGRSGDGAVGSTSSISPDALRRELDEARALKDELNIHLERIELIVEEMIR
ncbi:hypothetical protein [Luteimonas kalidii]|uniref:Uncharacterized protein n=1 Tax=Luteimonas kalidii TaxID=3042025 RepID=A0ABT6JYS9_9GAMM|nr:hypothetical protein [Luteimonas kalidii]MDH5835662.1 hypothetical protein [Luteimonas kalidii]